MTYIPRASPATALRNALLPPLAASGSMGSRMANMVLTAQVQVAYECAHCAHDSAQRAATHVIETWPDTPLRTIVLGAYKAQTDAAEAAMHDVLERARRTCGLAFARATSCALPAGCSPPTNAI